jgi:hypothetical protein
MKDGGRIASGLQVHGIEFTDEGIFELDEGARSLFIDKAIIRKCVFRRGLVAERIVLGLTVGIAMVTAGAASFLRFSFDLSTRLGGRLVLVSLMLVGLGLVIVRHCVRRGVYLELETERGVRKLTVGKSVPIADLQAALPDVAKRYGYFIELAVDG